MAATSTSRMVLPIAFVAAGVMALLAFQHVRHESPNDPTAATPPTASEQSSGARDFDPAVLAAAQATASAVAAAVGGSAVPPDGSDGLPAFDVARIEPTGEAVIAGRAAPGATVELLRDGEFYDRAVADRSGQFVMVPPRLPSGTYDLSLRSMQQDGKQTRSRHTVTVVLEPSPNHGPLVALMTPHKPTVVLSQPAAPKISPGTVVVDAVETEPGGKLHVIGQARPGASVRLYLNDSFITLVMASREGRFAVTINGGIGPGSYRVRLDEVDLNSGAVRARAEVPFNVPHTVVTAARATASERSEISAAQPLQLAAAIGAILPDGGSSSVVVPKIATTTVARGDNLWRLSRITYGAGTRYVVIYRANREQIRNPNWIYPGQIFVLPSK